MRKLLWITLMVIFIAMPLEGCKKDEFALNAYKTLETSGIAYNTVMEAAADMQAAGKLSDENWNKLRDVALVYYDSYQLATSALAFYMEILENPVGEKPTKEQLSALVDNVSQSISDLLECAINLGITVKEQRDGAE